MQQTTSLEGKDAVFRWPVNVSLDHCFSPRPSESKSLSFIHFHPASQQLGQNLKPKICTVK